MNIKTTVVTLGIAGILLVSPGLTFAQTTAPVRAANQAARLASLHTVADTAITNRLASLQNAATRINSLAKLSSSQKTQFNGEITTDVNGLTSLKTKVDADTDLVTLRTDYKSIFTSYRVYAEFLPQIHLLTASDTMDVTADKLNDLATKLQSRIQTAGNLANLTSLLTDMQSKIKDAQNQYAQVQSQVAGLTPQSFDSNPSATKATLVTARAEIKTGGSDLKTAFADAKQIRQGLSNNKTVSPVPTQ